MKLENKFLDIRQLKELLRRIENVASAELKSTLANYTESTRMGNYLCNIFNQSQMDELENLAIAYGVFALL